MNTYFFGDTAILLGRTLKHVTRSVDTIITTAIMPVAIMLLLVYVFGGAINTGSDSYVAYMLPGILLITSPREFPTPHFGSSVTCRAASSSDSSRCRSHGRACCGRTC